MYRVKERGNVHMINYTDLKGQLTLDQLEDLIYHDRLDLQDILGQVPLGYHELRIDYYRDVNLNNVTGKNRADVEDDILADPGTFEWYYGNICDHIYDRIKYLMVDTEEEYYNYRSFFEKLTELVEVDFPLTVTIPNFPEEEDN